MIDQNKIKRSIVAAYKLPRQYPTHVHDAKFWENLGRTIATFGFLEETLGKAIFAFTGTRIYDESEIEAALERWLPTLEGALIDPLGNLINSYEKAVRDNPNATISNLDELVGDLRKASGIRNVLCHGSWRSPDEAGRSVPLFVSRKKEVFNTPVDVSFLQQTQRHVVELVCAIVNTVTHMGWQFPGSNGPGNPIMDHKS